MRGIIVSLHEDHRKFLSYPAQCYVTRALSALLSLDAVTSNVKVETSGSPKKPTDVNAVKHRKTFFFYIYCTVFAVLFRLNKARHNFSTVRHVYGYWNLLFRLDVMHFVHICMLLQSTPQYVNLYLNITVPLKLRNGTTSHVVFCYTKKSDNM